MWFFHHLCTFLVKIRVLELQTSYFRQQLSYEFNFWFWWNLRLYIFEKAKFQKRGGKGGARCIFEMAWWLCKKIRISSQKLVLELRIMVYLVGTNIRERCPPFCPPFLCSIGCPPFHIRAPRIENAEFSTFLRLDPLFISAYRGLPPLFAPPFFKFEKFKRSSTNFAFIIFRQNALF